MLLALLDGVKACGKGTLELAAWQSAITDALLQVAPGLFANLLCNSLVIAEDRRTALVAALIAGPHVLCPSVSRGQLRQFFMTAMGQGRSIKVQESLDFARFDQTDPPIPGLDANMRQTWLHLVNLVTIGTLGCLLLVVVGAAGVMGGWMNG